MFHLYHVYQIDRYGVMQYVETVRSVSESSAIEEIYMRLGSASKYTGASRESFVAERVK